MSEIHLNSITRALSRDTQHLLGGLETGPSTRGPVASLRVALGKRQRRWVLRDCILWEEGPCSQPVFPFLGFVTLGRLICRTVRIMIVIAYPDPVAHVPGPVASILYILMHFILETALWGLNECTWKTCLKFRNKQKNIMMNSIFISTENCGSQIYILCLYRFEQVPCIVHSSLPLEKYGFDDWFTMEERQKDEVELFCWRMQSGLGMKVWVSISLSFHVRGCVQGT